MDRGADEMLQRLPVELQLLLSIIRMEHDNEAQDEIRQLTERRIDWDRFVHLARQHRLYPAAAAGIRRLGAPAVPERVMTAIHQLFVHNTFRMLQLTAVMENVCCELAGSDIPVLVLKGPVIAEALYGDFSLRTSKDLDILVPQSRIGQAVDILLRLGFDPDDETSRLTNAVKRKKHHLSYTNRSSGVQVELHWRMSSDTFKESAFEELWERRRVTARTTRPVYYLGQEDLFVYLVSHGARHAWFRLRWLNDIERMMRMEMDWEVVVERFRQLRKLHVAGQALLLVSELYRVPLHQPCQAVARRGPAVSLASEAISIIAEYVDKMEKLTPAQYNAYFKRYNSMLLSARQRWKRTINKLYPDDTELESLALPRWLHFMYFPLRPLLWYRRKRKQRVTV